MTQAERRDVACYLYLLRALHLPEAREELKVWLDVSLDTAMAGVRGRSQSGRCIEMASGMVRFVQETQ